MPVVQLRVLGGAMARVPALATAYAHRTPGLMANIAALTEALRRRDGAAAGFLGDEGHARVHEAYPGRTWQRLTEIERRYDPNDLFRLNQNIPPAPAPTG